MDPAQLASLYPTLYHMAEDGSWPSIGERGLLSTQAIIDLYQPDEQARAAMLSSVRRTKITLTSTDLGDVTIRDQLPAKFLEKCMYDGVDPAEFLDALNSRVFFWVSLHRLERLLNARYYRNLRHTVLRVDTAALLEEYADDVQLAPYNTGSMHVPTVPKRGPGTFVNLADYPYGDWVAKRGRSGEPIVELTVKYAVPDIANFVTRVETWADGHPADLLYER
jgi:Family of unknown function (DUF7002)